MPKVFFLEQSQEFSSSAVDFGIALGFFSRLNFEACLTRFGRVILANGTSRFWAFSGLI